MIKRKHQDRELCQCGVNYASRFDDLCDKCRGATVHSAKLRVSKNQHKQRKMRGKYDKE